MSSTWFLFVVLAVVVLVALLVTGLLVARRRRITLDAQREVEEKPKGGSYAASGGIALAPGGEAPEHPVEDRPETDGQPAVGDDAAVPRDSAQRTVRDVKLPEEPTAAPRGRSPRRSSPRPAAWSGCAAGCRSRDRCSGTSLLGLLGAGDLDEDSWQDVEDTLLMADLGAATTAEIVLRCATNWAASVRTSEEARAVLHEVLTAALSTDGHRAVRALPHQVDGQKQPAVVLVAGVNGTGKTTTTGKLARVLVAQGSTVVLGAADTFRAAAADQLQTWAERVGAEVVRGKEGADPAAVAFDAVKRGIETASTRSWSTRRAGCTRRPA